MIYYDCELSRLSQAPARGGKGAYARHACSLSLSLCVCIYIYIYIHIMLVYFWCLHVSLCDFWLFLKFCFLPLGCTVRSSCAGAQKCAPQVRGARKICTQTSGREEDTPSPPRAPCSLSKLAPGNENVSNLCPDAAAPLLWRHQTCDFRELLRLQSSEGNSQRLAKSSPYAGPSTGKEVARLWKWHVWCLLKWPCVKPLPCCSGL